MDCREFEAELDRRLDERLDPRTPELTAHAERCVGCGELLRDAVLLLRGVTAWKQSLPAHAGDLAARITRDVSGAPGVRPQVRSSAEAGSGKWQAWIVVAGSIAAMWLMFVGSPFHHSRGTDHRVAAIGHLNSDASAPPTIDRVPATGRRAELDADLDTVLVSAEGAYSQLADKTLEAAQDFALLWPTSQAVSDSTSPSIKPQNPDTNWHQSWPRELTPIGNSIGDALDFLRRAAPQIEKSAS